MHKQKEKFKFNSHGADMDDSHVMILLESVDSKIQLLLCSFRLHCALSK